jgi:hypothetical protein
MSNLSKGKGKVVEAAIVAASQEEIAPTTKITQKEKKEIIIAQSQALGVSLSTNEITQLLKETKQNVGSDRQQYIAIARQAIQVFRERLEQQSQQELENLANDFVEQMNESNTQFASQVGETFRKIGEQQKRDSEQSQSTFKSFQDSLTNSINEIFS